MDERKTHSGKIRPPSLCTKHRCLDRLAAPTEVLSADLGLGMPRCLLCQFDRLDERLTGLERVQPRNSEDYMCLGLTQSGKKTSGSK
jgi:hypothetical protein